MENKLEKWGFKNQKSSPTIRDLLVSILENVDETDRRPLVQLGRGDPSSFPCFRTSPVAEEAIINALKSAQFNGYAPAAGLYSARRSVADYLSRNLPYNLSPEDVYLTAGANHAIEVLLTIFARPGANLLLPRPGYPLYEARAAFSNLEARHFDLLPEKGWEVDLKHVESLADENTIAMVIINPGNPCGNVLTYEHLSRIAETAKKLGILVIADEVYSHLSFGCNKFVPMGTFGSVVPVITMGTISKRWIVPGWRLGWIVITDNNGTIKKLGLAECIESYINITADPATVMQGALPQILDNTLPDFFSNIVDMLRDAADKCYRVFNEIPCLTCPHKPDGAMSTLVKLNLSLLEYIDSDMDFCIKLAKEESVIILPGALGLENWLRITFAVELTALDDGLRRIAGFCSRHSKRN